jgi:hypothetical protein
MNPGGSPNLRELQALLYRLITAPDGVQAGLDAETEPIDLEMIIARDERLNGVARLGIYANAYFYRLLDALKEDFPAILAIIGADEFHNLITGYLLEYPPAEPSMLYAGKHLASYIECARGLDRWPFLADLARLERALIDSFHAADAIALDRAAMQSVPPAAWPSLYLRLHPAARLLRACWRVDEIARAVMQDAEVPAPKAAQVTIVVWRNRSQVNYRTAEPIEAIALSLIEAGAGFASVCGGIAEAANQDDAPRLINHLLARWLADGVLVRQPAEAQEA